MPPALVSAWSSRALRWARSLRTSDLQKLTNQARFEIVCEKSIFELETRMTSRIGGTGDISWQESALGLSARHARTMSRFGILPGGTPERRNTFEISAESSSSSLYQEPPLGVLPQQVGGDREKVSSAATSAMLAVIKEQAAELSELRNASAQRRADEDNDQVERTAAHSAFALRIARERQDMLAKLDATGRLLERREEQLLALGAGELVSHQKPCLGGEVAELREQVAHQAARLQEGEAYSLALETDVTRLRAALAMAQRDQHPCSGAATAQQSEAAEIARLNARVRDLEREVEAVGAVRCKACDSLSAELVELSRLALRARLELAGLGRLVRQAATHAPLSIAPLFSRPRDHNLEAGAAYKDGVRDLEAILEDLAGLRSILTDAVAERTAACAQQ